MASSSNFSSSSSSSSSGAGYGAPLYSGSGGGGSLGGSGGAGQGGAGPSGAGSSPGNKYQCPNCGKAFSRDDLLRRHLAREARSMAQPQFDRQKSCFECARSKARCDLEVPSCGRCRARGKHCVYGARSGNPNVRRQRDSVAPPANLSSMSIGTGSQHSDMGGVGSSSSPYGWASGGDTSYYSDSSHGSVPQTPGSIHSNDDSGSESGVAWSESGQVPYGGPHAHNYASSSASLPLQATGAYGGGPTAGHAVGQGGGIMAPPIGPIDQAPVVTPTTFMARHSHGPSMASTGRLITDLDRSAPTYKNEDGEETPIGRMVNSFAAGPSSMTARGPDPALDRRPRGGMGPPMQHLPPSGQMGQHGPMHQQQGAPHHLQQQQHSHAQSPHSQHFSSSTSWIPQTHYAPMTSTPPNNNQQQGSSSLMGPPVGLPHRMNVPGEGSSSSLPFASPTRGPPGQRPQPHRLLTGAAMPQPPQSSSGTNVSGINMPPGSGKPLFSAMVDLTGWLEDPVVPSPLYPTGPSMAPFAPSGLDGSVPGDVSGQQQPQASLDTLMQGNDQSQQQQTQSSSSQQQIPASRYWWANPPSHSDYNLMQGVAQASANHLSHYPALMVLPEPSSPVPPTVHRSWMATMRGNIPAYLAIARVVLAGYAVRLPASEAVVWESVAREARRIVESHEAISSDACSALELFGATLSLFFYCILLMMCNDAGAVGHVDVGLTNSAFFGLSQLAGALARRVQAAQAQAQQKEQQRSMEGNGSSNAGSEEWMEWGFVESMRRTVWAAYAMLVLQRYRDSADMSQGRLAGVDLILDVQLPAPALEFEAGTLEDWKKAKAALYSSDESGSVRKPTLTFRDLLRHRPVPSNPFAAGSSSSNGGSSSDPSRASSSSSASSGASGSAPKELLDYFERHDAFVATVLSIAFCLDANLSSG
ncbi:hypothetical protein BDZ90DRAFT_21551 [Jaminaea rosea]|uniref:Zn(2)-C6 fungal-type domain-containing protein n=1 Tax=Jaminaea rosea TaxID=1569628 RepID=A0A316UZK3_9BASI|nr:hypothetical protein BDZ90DRAFT_21551 [Jaminaea rosea]PWN30716.1 hypothetical protein BDZ90DRAFT_21551 [Jaminaea rosea]